MDASRERENRGWETFGVQHRSSSTFSLLDLTLGPCVTANDNRLRAGVRHSNFARNPTDHSRQSELKDERFQPDCTIIPFRMGERYARPCIQVIMKVSGKGGNGILSIFFAAGGHSFGFSIRACAAFESPA
jgi:hypothetical protein